MRVKIQPISSAPNTSDQTSLETSKGTLEIVAHALGRGFGEPITWVAMSTASPGSHIERTVDRFHRWSTVKRRVYEGNGCN